MKPVRRTTPLAVPHRRSTSESFRHQALSGLLVAAAFALMLAPNAIAEERRQPLVIKTMEYADRDVPRRGHTMNQVEDRYGEPQNRQGPVGEPPITRWQYPGFRVVFEGRHVIHSVVEPERPE